jgi:hypothetical protein
MHEENQKDYNNNLVLPTNKRAIIIVIVLFILSIAAFVTYSYGQKFNTKRKMSTQEVEKAMQEAKIEKQKAELKKNIVKNWPEYTDLRNRFEIKHPTDWVYEYKCTKLKQYKHAVCLYSYGLQWVKENNRDTEMLEKGEILVIDLFDEKQYQQFDSKKYCKDGCIEDELDNYKVVKNKVGQPVYKEEWFMMKEDNTMFAKLVLFFPQNKPEPISQTMISTFKIKDGHQQLLYANDGNSKGSCVRAGCNGELCIDTLENQGGRTLTSACEFKEEFNCLKQALCERQIDGTCDWTETEEYLECKDNIGSGF